MQMLAAAYHDKYEAINNIQLQHQHLTPHHVILVINGFFTEESLMLSQTRCVDHSSTAKHATN